MKRLLNVKPGARLSRKARKGTHKTVLGLKT